MLQIAASTIAEPSFSRLPGIHAVETYSPGARRLQPALVGVHRVEGDRALLVEHLDLREERLALDAAPRTRSRRRSGGARRRRPAACPRAAARESRGSARGRSPAPTPPAQTRSVPDAVRLVQVVRDHLGRRRRRRRADRRRSRSRGRRAARSAGSACETKTTVRPVLRELLHAPETAPLELGVAHREHLVDEQDLRLEVGRDGEREPDVHPARVALHRACR